MRFLLFRLPKGKDINAIIDDNSEENKASFVSFNDDEVLNLYAQKTLKLEKNQIQELLKSIKLPQYKEDMNFPNEEEYINKVEKTIEVIKENSWQKLVLSRPIRYTFEEIDLYETFTKLCEKYPQAFCYIWADEERVWLGASPELLGSYDKTSSEFETMSLAGTLSKTESWTEKEIQEQNAVTEYISNILKGYSKSIEITEDYEYILGNIKHLRTDFRAKIKNEELDKIIKDLHPTPAVCGFPKEECKAKILEIENYPRAYYSGYIRIEMEDKIYFFVNLRCGQLFEKNIVLYVGGGITQKSIPQNEWQETILKSQILLDNLVVK